MAAICQLSHAGPIGPLVSAVNIFDIFSVNLDSKVARTRHGTVWLCR